MGDWGVTARQSDSGLDYLHVAIEKCLKPINFNYFDVKYIMETLENHIIEKIRQENEPYVEDKERIQEYIDANFPHEYNTVILLVSECLTEYHLKGKITLYDYEVETDREIFKFIYTDDVLDELFEKLHEMLDPEHWLYKAWFEDETREEWLSHMKEMCDSLSSLKGRKGHG